MKTGQQQELESSLRASPRPAAAALALPAALLTLFAYSLPDATTALILASLLYATAALLWIICNRHPAMAAPVTLGAYVTAVVALALIVQRDDLLLLSCLVTAMAGCFGGERLAIYTASAQAVILSAVGLLGVASWQPVALGIALNGGVLAALLTLLQPVRTLAYWSFERYERAQALLEEARDRQAELKQTLEALAQSNRELALAHDRLAAMRLVAEDARRTKAAFVSNVSHEFRAPLNIIIGLTEILLDARRVYGRELPVGAREDVGILQRNCQHLLDLINDVLDLSQIEADQLAMRREWVDLGAIISNAADMVRPLIEAKGLAFEVIVPGDLEAVYCDPRRIRQVILNLVSNAARFTEQGRISIAARREAEQVLVSVEDTGPGIRVDDIERIFEPFQQSGSTGAVLGKGSGLGLAISREFVRMHDGRIWVETTPGSGSTFHFRLPVRPAAEPRAGGERWLTPTWFERVRTARSPAAQLGDRVVVHDRTHRLAGALARYAGDLTLVEAPNRDAVAALSERESARAVVLCADDAQSLVEDVQLVAQQLASTPTIGIVVCKPTATDELLGAVDYIVKPVSSESVRRACERVCPAPSRFLIVDDEPDARHVITTHLQRLYAGAEVRDAGSGLEMLNVASSWRPDIILLDVVMPEMDGWQALAALKARPELATLPVAMLSGQDRHPEPLMGSLVLATIHEGMSLGKLIAVFRALNDVLLPHSAGPVAAPQESQSD